MIWNKINEIGKRGCIPFHLSLAELGGRFRFGGGAPEDVKPPAVNQFTRFLMTIPLTHDLEVSLFSSFDMEGENEWSPYERAFELMDENSKIIQFVVHVAGKRFDKISDRNAYPACGLILGKESEETEGDLYEFHKIGGMPYFEKDFGLAKMLESRPDYLQLLQLAFPVGPQDDVLKLTWPFGLWVFHVFVFRGQDEWSFLYCWG